MNKALVETSALDDISYNIINQAIKKSNDVNIDPDMMLQYKKKYIMSVYDVPETTITETFLAKYNDRKVLFIYRNLLQIKDIILDPTKSICDCLADITNIDLKLVMQLLLSIGITNFKTQKIPKENINKITIAQNTLKYRFSLPSKANKLKVLKLILDKYLGIGIKVHELEYSIMVDNIALDLFINNH
jgi:hypothetical protein